jgi:hypothetical protein
MKQLIKAGQIVMVFKRGQDAGKAREKLLAAQFLEHEITEWSDAEVLADLREARNKIVSLQYKLAQERYLALAKRGSGFLVVYAPSESASRRVVDLVREFGLQLAEKYSRFTIEEMAAYPSVRFGVRQRLIRLRGSGCPHNP